jgi:type IV pilus assembly protein PilQ
MVNHRRETIRPRVPMAVALLLAGMLLVPTVLAGPTNGSAQAAGDVKEALVLERVTAGDSSLVLVTSAAPSFSSYSPQPMVFVIDLPLAVKSSAVEIPKTLPAAVASVAADEAYELGSGLTRVTIRLTENVKPEAVATAQGIEVRFNGPAKKAAAVSQPIAQPAETVPPLPAVPTMVSPEPPAPVVKSTPAVKALPAATRLEKVTRVQGSGLTVALVADGSPDYTAFVLESPRRLVVDLNGVTNFVEKQTLSLDSDSVARVRVAQFQSAPAVTRVVFDLNAAVDYKVNREGNEIRVSFGSEPAQVARFSEPVAQQYVAPAPVEPEPVTVELEDAPVFTAVNEPSVFDMAPAIPVVPEVQTVSSRQTERHVVRAGAVQSQPDMGTEIGGAEYIRSGESRTLSAGERVYTGEPLDLSLKDADIKDVLRMFSQLTGLNIAIDPQVAGTVTVEFIAVPWDQALEIILRQNGLAYVLQGNVMRVGTITRLSEEASLQRKLEEENRLNVATVTIIKDLSYATANEVATLLNSMASPKGKIIVDQRTNQLIITEVPEYLQTMLNLIETVDIPTPQVIIEARIVETTKNFLQQFGIDWGFNAAFDPALGTGPGLVFPNQATVGGGPFTFGKGDTILSMAFSDVLGAFDLDIALTAAESEGLARIVSAPKIVTQDNESAEIQSGVQIPVQTRVNFTTTVQYVDATLRLQVTPQITANDTVIMQIQVQKTEPATGLAVGESQNVPLLTRRAQTRLMVRDGGTTVIGGIYQATENTAQDRVPFLHKIPVLGLLFKNKDIQSRHDELLIFITPKIVRQT